MALRTERWRRVEEIFCGLLELPPEERSARLDEIAGGDAELRAEVASLLASDASVNTGFVEDDVSRAVFDMTSDDPVAAMEGRMVGPYRLIRELGKGGMGSVYLATRADEQYESRVAVKLIRPGLADERIVRRFRNERQILARLEHPNIARLFDGGATPEGSPWFAMEFVDGDWITRYADARSLSVEDRIRLFLPVCAAVDFAHRHLIVHRDLKPANVLVNEGGVPKLVDFGISKLLSEDSDTSRTQAGQGMLTPDYASPEQVLGEPISIASDVYSLGAVLYELLCGRGPHRLEGRTALAIHRAICENAIDPPSAAANDAVRARRLKGDLDNIVLRAIHREPTRRYGSAEQLADDLRRHLQNRPLAARADSIVYRTGKFLRRNRVAVSLAAAALCAVVAFAGIAAREALLARRRFDDVRQLATTFVFDVEDSARNLPGSLPVRRKIVNTGLEYLDRLARSSSRDWELKRELADAYMKIGMVQFGASAANLGDSKAALASFNSAAGLLDEVLGHAPEDSKALLSRLRVYSELSDLNRRTGREQAALADLESELRLASRLLETTPKAPAALYEAGVAHLNLARLRINRGNFEAAEREALLGSQMLQPLAAAKPGDRAAGMNLAESYARLGNVWISVGRRREALGVYGSQAATLEGLSARFPNDTEILRNLMLSYSHLGDYLGNYDYDNEGDAQGARRAYDKMLGIARALREADPSDARAASDYAIATLRLGIVTPFGPDKLQTLQLAEGLLEDAIRRNPTMMVNSLQLVWVEYELGNYYLEARQIAEAERRYRLSIALAEKTMAAGTESGLPRRHLISVRRLAETQAREGDRAGALATLQRALARATPPDPSAAPLSPIRLYAARAAQAAGSVYAILGDREKAIEWYRRSLDGWDIVSRATSIPQADRVDIENARKAVAELEAGGGRAIRSKR